MGREAKRFLRKNVTVISNLVRVNFEYYQFLEKIPVVNSIEQHIQNIHNGLVRAENAVYSTTSDQVKRSASPSGLRPRSQSIVAYRITHLNGVYKIFETVTASLTKNENIICVGHSATKTSSDR